MRTTMGPETKKYKVTGEGVELDGVAQEVGAEVELTDDQAAQFEGKVEAVEAQGEASQGDTGSADQA